MSAYDFKTVEARWQQRWSEAKAFATPPQPQQKFYLLEMFAYPSGDIHMGHFRNYTLGDAVARYKMMQGYDLLHPFGWDAFGLPAEEAAIKRDIDPERWTGANIEQSRATLQKVGISYDWEREIVTCRPDYYWGNQWIFLKLLEHRLAYRALSWVNWCPSCQTVLANEQVEQGVCWRCHSVVTRKKLEQWFVKITAYADRLLEGLDRLPGWPENVRAMQRNWIGRSTGARVEFRLEGTDEPLSVFTTRPDTLYGVTFMAAAPEHPLAERLMDRDDVRRYVEKAMRKSDRDRAAEGEKDGVFSGLHAVHPLTGEKVPLWIADYVLAGYGTGLVMGVPAHDTRDFAFARKYGLPVKVAIQPPGTTLDPAAMTDAYVDEGTMAGSGPFDGVPSAEGIEKVTEYLKDQGRGEPAVHYRLKDWLISRQRYWGTPIPVIHCPACGVVPVPYPSLPVVLPPADQVDFIPKGRSPLADCRSFIETECPNCGGLAERDPDTMDTFVDSSWYHLRYLDPKNPRALFTRDAAATWMPIDLYIGGVEHATGHCIYFRFITKFLYDLGMLGSDEPARALFNHGMVLDENGVVMSKSLGNVVSPTAIMDQVGVDNTRMAMFFAAPSHREVLWSNANLAGVVRFTQRIWDRFSDDLQCTCGLPAAAAAGEERKLLLALNNAISRVTDGLDKMSVNTSIAALMELLNLLEKVTDKTPAYFHCLETFVKLLAPIAPHLAEELWETAGHPTSVFRTSWPEVRADVQEHQVEIPIQIGGRVKDRILVPASATEADIKARALESPRVQETIDGRSVKKIIVVPGKMVSIVL